jgi:hypothetical protein
MAVVMIGMVDVVLSSALVRPRAASTPCASTVSSGESAWSRGRRKRPLARRTNVVPTRFALVNGSLGEIRIGTPDSVRARAFRILVNELGWEATVGALAMSKAEAPLDSVAERLHAVARRRASLTAGGCPRRCHTADVIRGHPLALEKIVGTAGSLKAADGAPRTDSACTSVSSGGW